MRYRRRRSSSRHLTGPHHAKPAANPHAASAIPTCCKISSERFDEILPEKKAARYASLNVDLAVYSYSTQRTRCRMEILSPFRKQKSGSASAGAGRLSPGRRRRYCPPAHCGQPGCISLCPGSWPSRRSPGIRDQKAAGSNSATSTPRDIENQCSRGFAFPAVFPLISALQPSQLQLGGKA